MHIVLVPSLVRFTKLINHLKKSWIKNDMVKENIRMFKIHFSWRRPKWIWLVEFSEMNAVFSLDLEQFIGGEFIKSNQLE